MSERASNSWIHYLNQKGFSRTDGYWMLYFLNEDIDLAWTKSKHLFDEGKLPGVDSIKVQTKDCENKKIFLKIMIFYCEPAESKEAILSVGRVIIDKMNYRSPMGTIIYKSNKGGIYKLDTPKNFWNPDVKRRYNNGETDLPTMSNEGHGGLWINKNQDYNISELPCIRFHFNIENVDEIWFKIKDYMNENLFPQEIKAINCETLRNQRVRQNCHANDLCFRMKFVVKIDSERVVDMSETIKEISKKLYNLLGDTFNDSRVEFFNFRKQKPQYAFDKEELLGYTLKEDMKQ